MPLISVITAVKNGERFLPETIESIRGQTLRDFEWLIVDNGSTDGTLDLLDRAASRDRRLRILSLPDADGPYQAANYAARFASGDFVARTDADDVSRPDRFAKQIDMLNQHSPRSLCIANYDYVDAATRTVSQVRLPLHPAALHGHLLVYNPVCHSTLMLSRRMFATLGGYGSRRLAQDYDLFLRAAEHAPIAVVHEPLVQFRIHGHRMTANENDGQFYEAMQVLCRAFDRLLSVKVQDAAVEAFCRAARGWPVRPWRAYAQGGDYFRSAIQLLHTRSPDARAELGAIARHWELRALSAMAPYYPGETRASLASMRIWTKKTALIALKTLFGARWHSLRGLHPKVWEANEQKSPVQSV